MAKKTTIKDLIHDDKNFNKGTEFGGSLIEKSLRKFGAGRSILIDKNNRIIAGNKTIENAAAIGLEDLQIVESDGTRIIAVKRMDIDLDSKAGRELALADNATAKANIDWDVETTFEVANEYEFDAGEWGVNKHIVNEDEYDTTLGGDSVGVSSGEILIVISDDGVMDEVINFLEVYSNKNLLRFIKK